MVSESCNVSHTAVRGSTEKSPFHVQMLATYPYIATTLTSLLVFNGGRGPGYTLAATMGASKGTTDTKALGTPTHSLYTPSLILLLHRILSGSRTMTASGIMPTMGSSSSPSETDWLLELVAERAVESLDLRARGACFLSSRLIVSVFCGRVFSERLMGGRGGRAHLVLELLVALTLSLPRDF